MRRAGGVRVFGVFCCAPPFVSNEARSTGSRTCLGKGGSSHSHMCMYEAVMARIYTTYDFYVFIFALVNK